jgi:hypothetical protein
MEDPRLTTLRDLLAQASELQEETTKLIEEITDQLQRSIFMHDEWGNAIVRAKPDRRRTPRDKKRPR